jgi:hypothetical protein
LRKELGFDCSGAHTVLEDWFGKPNRRLFGAFVPVSFYEAEFVKTRCENSFLFILIHFGRHLAATYLLAFGA